MPVGQTRAFSRYRGDAPGAGTGIFFISFDDRPISRNILTHPCGRGKNAYGLWLNTQNLFSTNEGRFLAEWRLIGLVRVG
jgi:hypothetical protein